MTEHLVKRFKFEHRNDSDLVYEVLYLSELAEFYYQNTNWKRLLRVKLFTLYPKGTVK